MLTMMSIDILTAHCPDDDDDDDVDDDDDDDAEVNKERKQCVVDGDMRTHLLLKGSVLGDVTF